MTAAIDPISNNSLYIESYRDNIELSSATGIVIEADGGFYLVTNRHIVTGRNNDTGEILHNYCAEPNRLKIFHHSTAAPNSWTPLIENLFDEHDKPLWINHPDDKFIDIAFLPLTNFDSMVAFRPLDLSLADADMLAMPAMTVSIVGYPFGRKSTGFFPIWKTGHIASDFDFPCVTVYGKKMPCFLIDATTKKGMSGSPVYLRSPGSYVTEGGGTMLGGAMNTRFLGIYSGLIEDDIEIGRVWRASALTDIVTLINSKK